jgi:hypothetical protein
MENDSEAKDDVAKAEFQLMGENVTYRRWISK